MTPVPGAATAGIGAAPFLLFMGAVLIALGAFAVWVERVLRAAGIRVADVAGDEVASAIEGVTQHRTSPVPTPSTQQSSSKLYGRIMSSRAASDGAGMAAGGARAASAGGATAATGGAAVAAGAVATAVRAPGAAGDAAGQRLDESPLLLFTSAARTVTVTMEPVGAGQAIREVEHRTTELAEQHPRESREFLTTYRKAREQEAINRRAAELQEGYADFRFSGHVTVSAATEEELHAACSDVVHAAQQPELDLRRLAGEQDVAFAYTLPLGRGLR